MTHSVDYMQSYFLYIVLVFRLEITQLCHCSNIFFMKLFNTNVFDTVKLHQDSAIAFIVIVCINVVQVLFR